MKQFSEVVTINAEQVHLFAEQAPDNKPQMVEFFKSHTPTLCRILSQYDFVDGSRGSVNACEIDASSVLIDGEGNCSFKVLFTVQYYYACDYITKDFEQTMLMQTRVDVAKNQVLIHGERWNERDMDEF